MKNSFIYVCIFFLLIILGGIVELRYLIVLSNEMINFIDTIDKYESIDKKTEEVINLRKKWEKNVKVLSMLIDHQDIHKIESGLVEIEMILKNNFSSSQISTNFALLKLYIKDIAEERRFISENIL